MKIKMGLLVLGCLLFFEPFSISLRAADLEFRFYSAARCEDVNKNIYKAIIGGLRSEKRIKPYGEGRRAIIPSEIVKEYLFPKIGDNLYFFVDSKMVGKAHPIEYAAYTEFKGYDEFSFAFKVDKKNLGINDEEKDGYSNKWGEYYRNGIFISRTNGSEIKSLEDKGLNNTSVNMRNLTEKEIQDVMNIAKADSKGIERNKLFFAEYEVEKSCFLSKENTKVVQIKSKKPAPSRLGGGYFKFLLIFNNNSIKIIGDQYLAQIFRVDKRSFLITNIDDAGSVHIKVYEVLRNGLTEIETMSFNYG